MDFGLEVRRCSGPIYRLGRRPDPWQLPPWSFVQKDGTFGNRFDDPDGYYRVLYTSSQRLGCFMETLARFRPDLSLLAELNSIDGPDDFFPLGVVPRDWLAVRTMGTANIDGEFADIYAVEWVSYLRGTLAAEALGLGIHDIDLSTLLMAEPRRITQLASREAYRMSAAGIFYPSRYGQSLENWALFEPVSLQNEQSRIVAADDPDLGAALSLLAIELEGAR
jgi:RES domain